MGADTPPAIRGIRVLTYASAAAFLETEIPSNPECVVLDIQLGGMSELELVSRLRGSGHTVPIMIITAHDDAQVRDELKAIVEL